MLLIVAMTIPFFQSHHICQNTSMNSVLPPLLAIASSQTLQPRASVIPAVVAMPWLCFHHIAIWLIAKMPRNDVGSCCLLALQINYVSRKGNSASSLYGDGDI